MADERYTLELNTKIKGDLDKGLKGIYKSAKKSADSVEKIGDELGQINTRPIRDLQQAGEQFGKTMSKLKPKSLNDMSVSAKKLSASMNSIKPKPLEAVGKAATKVASSLNKLKPKGLESVSKAAQKMRKSLAAIKPKPLNDISLSAKRMKKNIDAISAKPLRDLSDASKQLAGNINKVNATPFRSLGREIERTNSRVLNFISNLILMGNNLQGLVLLAVNRLKAAFVEMTDQLNRVIGQMAKWEGSMEKALRTARALQGISIDTGWDLDALSSTFTKLGVGFEQMQLGTEKLLELTRGLGLVFRQVGADGDKMAKIAGQIATMFTRDTIPFEKLESLLGRGRFEQILKDLAEQLLKIKGIDLSNWGARTQNVLATIKQMMDAGAISGADLAQAWIALLEEGNKLSDVASEIGQGFDQLKNSVIVLITRLDQAIGFSSRLASIFSLLADGVKLLADNVELLLKLGLIGALSFIVVNMKKIYGWLIAIISVIGGASGKLKPLLKILSSVKTIVGAIIAAVVLLGKELDAALDKYQDQFGHIALFQVLKTITKTLAGLEKVANKMTGKDKIIPKDEIGKPKSKIGELDFNQGPPGERGKPPKIRSVAEVEAEMEAERQSLATGREDYKAAVKELHARRQNLLDQLVNDLPGLDVKAVHEQLQAVYGDFLKLQGRHGTTLRKSPELRAQNVADEQVFSRLSPDSDKNPWAKTVGPKLDPKIFLTGLRGEVAQIRKEITSAQANLQMGRIDKKEFEEVMARLGDRLDDAVLRGSDEIQLRGLPGGERHQTALWGDIKRAETLLAPYKQEEETPVVKAIRELGDRQSEIWRARERGDITPEEYGREQISIHGEGRAIKRQFTDELDPFHVDADKAAVRIGEDLNLIIEEAANYLPPATHMFAGYIEQLQNLKQAYADGAIDSDEFIEGLHNVGKSLREAEKANYGEVRDDPFLKGIVDDIKEETANAVEYFKPLNTGTRNLAQNLVDLHEAQKQGYLTGDKLIDSYVSLNQQARDFRAAHAAQLQSNPRLLAQLNNVIKSTDGWAKKLKKIPKPEGGYEKFSQSLGIGPAEGEKDPGKIAEGLSQRRQAGGIIKQGVANATDRIFEEGTQGRDLGPAGDIGKDFVSNLITMGPVLAALIAALQLITEILVQAADMANLFGEGLQAFFDPMNELITLVADSLSPVFNILGNIFSNIGQVASGFVAIVRPIFKVIKSIFQVFQALATPFKVLANVVGLVLKAIGVLYSIALKPLADFFTNLARTIVSMINRVIDAINSLIPGTRWDLDYVSLEGKRHVPEEEKEQELAKDREPDDTANKQRAKMLAELELLRRINQDMEKELRIQAQAAREVVRVKEIGSITEARQRGIISQEQAASEPMPLNMRVIATLDPREVDRHMGSEESQRVQMTNIRMNRDGIRDMVS